MSKLEELILKYCPDGVEWVRLGDYFTRIKGTPITAGVMKEIANENGDVRIFAGGKTIVNAFEKDIPNANITKVPAVLVQSRGVIDFVYYDKPFTFKSEMWAYTHTELITLKFLYYYCKNNVDYFRAAAGGMGSMPQISLPVTENFTIPLPPLPVQEEIVRILDLMVDLQNNIEAELKERKKQYEHYREQILGEQLSKLCPDGVVRVRLGDCCKILDAQRKPVAKGRRTEGKYPYYGANGIQDFVDRYLFDGTFLLVGEDGSVINKDNSPILNWAVGKIWVNNHAHILSEKADTALLRYIYYALQCVDISDIVRGVPPKLNQANLRDITIPLPSLPVQEEIVRILDSMTALQDNLEAELAERRKQYEYYRNKILSFE